MKKKLLFVAPVLTASGYGVHARQLLGALVKSGDFDIYVESLRWGETGFLADPDFDWIRKLADKNQPNSFDVAIQVTIPNEFKRRAPLTIGVTAGIEVDRVSPQWLLKVNQEVDLVVVPSEHSRAAFAVQYQGNDGSKLALQKPIIVVHEGVDTEVFRRLDTVTSNALPIDLPEKNFVFVGLGLDKPEGRDRKNITRLVEYFCRTFKGNSKVGLILKTAIVNSSTMDYEITKKRISDIKHATIGDAEFPKITLLHGRLSESDMASIYNDPRVISAISLTHGEGFGLPLIEAAASGIPIIATDWSGHLDFLNKDGRKLFVPVSYDLQEIWPDNVWQGVMEAGSRWAVPHEADACMKMQKMVMNSETPNVWATELLGVIKERFSLEVTGGRFVDLVKQALAEFSQINPPSREDFTKALRTRVKEKGPSLLYTMPMSAGDVFLSTGVVRALRQKHPGHRVYFATSGQYFSILENLYDGDVLLIDELIDWQPWMQDVSICEDIFDEVYTPNLAVQMTYSNWVHKGNGRNLIDEFAVQCGVDAMEPVLPSIGDVLDQEFVAVHSGGQKSARNYAHWRDIVSNLRKNGVKVIQVGAKDDVSVGEVDIDLRGKTDHIGLVKVLSSVKVFLGIDSYPMHVANVVGCKVVALFGSSYSTTTGPKNFRLPVVNMLRAEDRIPTEMVMEEVGRLVPIDTNDRNGCDRACYKDTCKVDASNPCINNIKPDGIFMTVATLVDPNLTRVYKPYRPKIAGYTHILNPKTHGYPYVESIESMLGFCDEVIVVDGGSTDQSNEDLEESFPDEVDSGKLKIITREWDPEEPGMDGMQKAFGRAMVSPDVDFLWQQDADEIVHEDDYNKIVDLCRRFPSDVDVIHLPVVELWGDDSTCRTDRHSWKWRLTRNNLRITHGINSAARLMDPNTGRFYAKKGMSDGCELIDIVTGDFLPHKGFYNQELEDLRLNDPQEYGNRMNEIISKIPSVWHYSWADLPRKVRNFRDFWDKQWQVLYQTPPQPRFADVKTEFDVEVKAEQLRVQGGEHGQAATFKLTKAAPKVMK